MDPVEGERTFRASTRDYLWTALGAGVAMSSVPVALTLMGHAPGFSLYYTMGCLWVLFHGTAYRAGRCVQVTSTGIRNARGDLLEWNVVSKVDRHFLWSDWITVQSKAKAVVIAPSVSTDAAFLRAVRECAPPGN